MTAVETRHLKLAFDLVAEMLTENTEESRRLTTAEDAGPPPMMTRSDWLRHRLAERQANASMHLALRTLEARLRDAGLDLEFDAKRLEAGP